MNNHYSKHEVVTIHWEFRHVWGLVSCPGIESCNRRWEKGQQLKEKTFSQWGSPWIMQFYNIEIHIHFAMVIYTLLDWMNQKFPKWVKLSLYSTTPPQDTNFSAIYGPSHKLILITYKICCTSGGKKYRNPSPYISTTLLKNIKVVLLGY